MSWECPGILEVSLVLKTLRTQCWPGKQDSEFTLSVAKEAKHGLDSHRGAPSLLAPGEGSLCWARHFCDDLFGYRYQS